MSYQCKDNDSWKSNISVLIHFVCLGKRWNCIVTLKKCWTRVGGGGQAFLGVPAPPRFMRPTFLRHASISQGENGPKNKAGLHSVASIEICFTSGSCGFWRGRKVVKTRAQGECTLFPQLFGVLPNFQERDHTYGNTVGNVFHEIIPWSKT